MPVLRQNHRLRKPRRIRSTIVYSDAIHRAGARVPPGVEQVKGASPPGAIFTRKPLPDATAVDYAQDRRVENPQLPSVHPPQRSEDDAME